LERSMFDLSTWMLCGFGLGLLWRRLVDEDLGRCRGMPLPEGIGGHGRARVRVAEASGCLYSTSKG
jgi:hypothetical protein